MSLGHVLDAQNSFPRRLLFSRTLECSLHGSRFSLRDLAERRGQIARVGLRGVMDESTRKLCRPWAMVNLRTGVSDSSHWPAAIEALN